MIGRFKEMKMDFTDLMSTHENKAKFINSSSLEIAEKV
jgi:hypothetical protein